MTAQNYIIQTLIQLREPQLAANIAAGSPTNVIEETIYAKVMSKKFRKLRADAQAQSITKQAIHLSVESNVPVKINVIFGGNKLWRFDESPEVDWAELFTTIYLLRWLKSIASVYGPGAYLEFYSEDVVLENMNNLPKAETDQYSQSFKAMLAWLQPYLPSNVTVGYKRYGDEYDRYEDYLIELEAAKTKVLAELGGKLPELTQHQREATELNVRVTPEQGKDPLWREKAELIHKSIERTPTMERYINDPTWVPACPTQFPGCITTGSTKKSIAKFWVAVGALGRKGSDYTEIVLTPKQLVSAKFDWEPVGIEGLPGKNFSRIRVLGAQDS